VNVFIRIFETPLSRSEQSVFAYELLDYALKSEFGVKRGEIIRGEHGKPYFRDSDIYFSYSHCKTAVACVVSKSEVGVDIERIREVSPAVIRRVCCDNELGIIKTAEDFIKIWTMKEAYAKFTGKGFAEGFKSVDTTVMDGVYSEKIEGYYVSVKY